MDFFYKLEQKYQRYAIQNLMYYIVICYGVGLIVQLFNPWVYWRYLCLDAAGIMRGQIWRVVTFLIYPPALGNQMFTSIMFGILALFLYYNLGRTLESVWGAFRFNVFFFMGVIGQVLAALVAYLVFRERVVMTTGFLNFSIFLAFSVCFPDTQFYLIVIPVKAKWLAIAECAVYAYSFLFGTLSSRVEILISLANVLVFLFITRRRRSAVSMAYRRVQKAQGRAKGAQEGKMIPKSRALHRCAVCGRTEKDGDELEFRFCSKCEGEYEYCQDHLYTHQHVTKQTENNS